MTRYVNSGVKERSEEPHPVWRGIGLILIIGIPILSLAISNQLMIFLDENNIVISEELLAPPVEIPFVGAIINWPALLVFAFLIALILYGFLAVVNAVVYSTSSRSTLQKFEAPPKQFKRKRKLKKPNYE
ncbi:MAG: hypothetical protein JW757_04005 [Anaerolineales bacterium]|nr:hypothetical protein [Anaerolineales bacterium]